MLQRLLAVSQIEKMAACPTTAYDMFGSSRPYQITGLKSNMQTIQLMVTNSLNATSSGRIHVDDNRDDIFQNLLGQLTYGKL